MATINLSWTRNSGGGTPTKYAIYRRIGDHAEGSVKSSPDNGFPIIVTNDASNDPAAETFTDTTNGKSTAVNSLYDASDALNGSGTYAEPASGSSYSYTVTAFSATGVESGNADNETAAKNILA